MVWAAGGGWGCVLPVPLNKAQEGAASDVRCPGHCGRLQMPPLELRKCMLVRIPGGHCREERNTAAQRQPTPVRYIEKIILNYLWSILVGTASESSSQVCILSSNMDGRRGLSYFGVEAHKSKGDSFVYPEFPLGIVSGWGLHGGRQGGKSPLLQQVQWQGLLGVDSRYATRAESAGTASHSRFIFPQTPSVFAVAPVPFGQTIFAVDTCQK